MVEKNFFLVGLTLKNCLLSGSFLVLFLVKTQKIKDVIEREYGVDLLYGHRDSEGKKILLYKGAKKMATLKDSATTLKLRVATGTGADGKTVFANRSVGNITPTITDEDFCLVGAGLASLQSHELACVIRTDTDTFEID